MSKYVFFCVHEAVMIANVRALREVFGVPVVSFFLWEYAEKEYTISQAEKNRLGPFYSFPSYYHDNIDRVRAIPIEQLNKKQAALEAELGIAKNPTLVSYDPYLSRVRDYRDSRNLQFLNLEFARMLFERHEPLFFLGGRESYLRNVVASACQLREAPTITTMRVRSAPHRVAAFDVKGQQVGMQAAFEELSNGRGETLDGEAIEQGDDRFDEFIEVQKRPNYAVSNTLSSTRSLKALFTSTPKAVLRTAKRYIRDRYDREAQVTQSPLVPAVRWPGKMAKMLWLEKTGYLNKTPDLSDSFIYHPLHMTPEVADLFYGEEYTHHAGFVTNLAKKIPSGCRLYVKEHTSMLGRRPISFYEELKDRFNIEVIHPSVSTFDLIKNAAAVLTVTGTAGWEAYLLGKPVIVLGNVFYNFLPGVLHKSLYDQDFATRLKEYMDSFAADLAQRRNAMRACFVSSKAIVDAAGSIDKVRGESEMAESHSRFVKRTLKGMGVIFGGG